MKHYSELQSNTLANSYDDLNNILLVNKVKISRLTYLISKITELYKKTDDDMLYLEKLKDYEKELMELTQAL